MNAGWNRFVTILAGLRPPVGGETLEVQMDRAIRQTNDQIKKSKEDRDASRAERIHAQQKATEAKAAQKALEEQASTLLRGHRKAAVKLLAVDISRLSEDRQHWETTQDMAKEAEESKSLLVDVLEGQMRRLKYQLGVFRAAANLQRTQEAIARTHVDDAAGLVGPPAVAPMAGKPSVAETPEQVLLRLGGAPKAEKKTRKSSTKTSTGKNK